MAKKADVLITFGIDEGSWVKMTEETQKRLESISDTLASKNLATNYSRMLNEIVRAFTKSLQGVETDIDGITSSFADKFEYLEKMREDFGNGGKLFDFFKPKDLEKVLKDFDKIKEKQKELFEIQSEAYKEQKKQDTLMSISDINEKYKFATESVEKYINKLKWFDKFHSIGIDEKSLVSFASLIDLYKQLDKLKTTPVTDDDIRKSQSLLTIRKEMDKIEEKYKSLTGFLKTDTDVKIKTTSTKLATEVNKAIGSSIGAVESQLNEEINKLKTTSMATANKIYNIRNQGFGGEIKDYTNLIEVDELLKKYIVDIDEAKEKIIELNKVTANQPYDKNKEKYNDLIGYVQRYLDLGGKLEELDISKTAQKIFNTTTDDFIVGLKEQISKLKDVKQVMFGIGGEFGEGDGTGSGGVGNGAGNGGVGGITEEQLNALLEKLNEINDSIVTIKSSIDNIGNSESLTNISNSFISIRDSFDTLKASLQDDGSFVQAINGIHEAIEKVNEAVSKFDNSNTQIEQLKSRINELSDAFDEFKTKNEESSDALYQNFQSNSQAIETTKEEAEAINEESTALSTLAEKLEYLKRLRSESKFMENAEERRMDMEDKAYDVGGNNPKSEADSQKKISMYEELCEHIESANTLLDQFEDTYEKVILTTTGKNGKKIEIFNPDDLTGLTLTENKIKDVQFVTRVSEEEIQNIISLFREFDDWSRENVDKQLFPPTVRFVSGTQEIQGAIDKLIEYRDKMYEALNSSAFNELKSPTQSDYSRTVSWLEQLIETENKILQTSMEIDRQNNQPKLYQGEETSAVNEEGNNFVKLGEQLDTIISKVERKNELFGEEQDIVKNATGEELSHLEHLSEYGIEPIVDQLEEIDGLLSSISGKSKDGIKINIDNKYEKSKKESSDKSSNDKKSENKATTKYDKEQEKRTKDELSKKRAAWDEERQMAEANAKMQAELDKQEEQRHKENLDASIVSWTNQRQMIEANAKLQTELEKQEEQRRKENLTSTRVSWNEQREMIEANSRMQDEYNKQEEQQTKDNLAQKRVVWDESRRVAEENAKMQEELNKIYDRKEKEEDITARDKIAEEYRLEEAYRQSVLEKEATKRQQQEDEYRRQIEQRNALIKQTSDEQETAFKRMLNLQKQMQSPSALTDQALYNELKRQEQLEQTIVEHRGEYLKELDDEYDHETRLIELLIKYDNILKDIDILKSSSMSKVQDMASDEFGSEKNKEYINWWKEQLKYQDEFKKESEKNEKNTEKQYKEIYKKPLKEYQSTYDKLNETSNLRQYTEEYEDLVKVLGTLIDQYKTLEGLDVTNTEQLEQLGVVKKSIDNTITSLNEMEKKANAVKAASIIKDITQYMNKNTRIGVDARTTLQSFITELKNTDISKTRLQEISREFLNLQSQINEAGKAGKSFFNIFNNKLLHQVAQQLSFYFSFRALIRYARTAVNTIKELDTALVDLRKTTKMNTTELEGFYKESNKIAQQMGVTTKEIINQASAWSRLGYSTAEQAEKMAALSSQFASISPDMDVSTATDGLVSTMKAFKIEVDDVERVVMDNINRIGKELPKHMVTYGIAFYAIQKITISVKKWGHLRPRKDIIFVI